MMLRQSQLSSVLLLALIAPTPIAGQDNIIVLPVSEIEERLGSQSFEILNMLTSRGLPSERTYAPIVRFEDGAMLRLKFAPAARGGEVFNNRPQYEVAAYELQKLFLDESEYVVPPTVARCFALDFVRRAIDKAPTREAIEDPLPTFDQWRMSLVVLQYWLSWNIEVADRDDIRDKERLENDEAFARHAGNFNLLTYLIRHNDSNVGNYLISTDSANPRIFSVDNGLAFSQRQSDESDRGTYWRELRIDRFPAASIERLRQVTLEGLHQALGVVAQFELRGGEFVPMEPTENLDPDKGIRRTDSVLQLGLTAGEIRNVHRRLTRLIERIDSGRYEVF
jgi:hypothetical protein